MAASDDHESTGRDNECTSNAPEGTGRDNENIGSTVSADKKEQVQNEPAPSDYAFTVSTWLRTI